MDNPEKLATQDTQQDEDKQNKTQHNMCQTPLYTREKTKTNKTKTIQRNWQHRIHNKTKTNKTKHNTICVRHHYAQGKTNTVNKT